MPWEQTKGDDRDERACKLPTLRRYFAMMSRRGETKTRVDPSPSRLTGFFQTPPASIATFILEAYVDRYGGVGRMRIGMGLGHMSASRGTGHHCGVL